MTEATTARVTSADGTVIGYRQLGTGPGLVLIHGGMMASQHLTKLAAELAAAFTVYVIDRRGRGLSGPCGYQYSVANDVQDLQAVLRSTGATGVFGLSSGGIIALEAARVEPALTKISIYEPPLSFADAPTTNWVRRYERELGQGDFAAAFVTVVKGTGDSALFKLLPRFLLEPFFRRALRQDARRVRAGNVSQQDLVPTMHYDLTLVSCSEKRLQSFADVHGPVLLLGGSKSNRFLHTALARLSGVLPDCRRIELPGVGHLAATNGGEPGRVADELQRFFTGG